MLWRKPFRKHCSDEDLLGHADGELSLPKELAVRKHLRLCWECRGRLAELEAGAEAVARTFADASFLGPDGVGRARSRFSDWEERHERKRDPVLRLVTLPSAPLYLRAAAIAAVLCIAAVTAWMLRPPAPAVILAAAQKAEAEWGGSQPFVHASLRIDVSEIRPVPSRRAARVELWSDREGQRLAVRWSDRRGALRYALWRSGAGHEYVLDSDAGRVVAPIAGAGNRGPSFARIVETEPTVDEMEEAFLRWLGSRQWRPIGLAANMAVFASSGGVILQAERVAAESGTPVIRLVVRRHDKRVTAEISLELDAATYRPRFEKLRLESGERVVELSVTLENVEGMPERALRPGIFQPEPRRTLPAVLPKQSLPHGLPERAAPTRPFESPRHRSDAFDAAQVDADYVLHLTGACRGESIEVVRQAPDSVVVRGVAATPERRAELLNGLSRVQSFALLRIDLKTLQDAASPPPSPALVRREVHTSPYRSPIQDLLEQAFGSGTEQTRFTNDAVSWSDSATMHAWALARLASAYSQKAAWLRPESRWLVETMLMDHVRGLRAATHHLKEGFDPLLQLITEAEADPLAKTVAPGLTWSDCLLSVLEDVRGVDRLVQALVAGAGLEGKSIDVAAGELRTALLRLDENLRRADIAIKPGLGFEGSSARLQ